MMTLNDVKLSFNFNLRRPCDARRATPIYCVVRLDHRQLKFPTALKVYPHHWDSRKQECVVSADMGEAERNDNMQANRVIFALRCKIDEIISYLCSGGVMVDADFIERYIKSKLTIPKDMANKNAIPPIRRTTATTLLEKAFGKYYRGGKQKESTVESQYTKLKVFYRFLKESDRYDSPDILSQDGLNDYKEWLVTTASNESRKTKRGAHRINDCCRMIERLINDVLCVNSEFRSFQFKFVRYKNISDSRDAEDMPRRALTNNEIKAIRTCETLTDVECEYRDLFLMQYETGVRVSDLQKLFTDEYEVDEDEDGITYMIKTKKKRVLAYIYVNDEIQRIQRKYINGFSFETIKQDDYNRALKNIFEKAGLTKKEYYSEDLAGRRIDKEDRLCDIITSHYARHTFITNKLREGITVEELHYMTGHKDNRMIDLIYSHLTHEDISKKVKQANNKSKKKNSPLNLEAVETLAVEKHEVTKQLNAERQRNASLEQMLTIEEQRREIEQRKHQHEMTAWATGTTLEEYRQTMAELDEQADEAEIDI